MTRQYPFLNNSLVIEVIEKHSYQIRSIYYDLIEIAYVLMCKKLFGYFN